MNPKLRVLVALLAVIVSFSVCPGRGFAQGTITLAGSGGTSALPVFRAWAAEYNKDNPAIRMQYLALDTYTSTAQILKGSGDFGAGDTPLTSEQRSQSLMALPIMLIAIVPIYNVPGADQELRFSGGLLAEIYLGKIKNWNDPRIARLNPHASLPRLPIKVIYQTRGKGSTFIFTDFLSKTSPKFRDRVGRGISPVWPVGSSAERSSAMADKVRKEPGSIGYVEVQYALENNIHFGSVMNAAGKFVKPSRETLAAACNAVEAPRWDNFSASLTNPAGADSYPIASFSWVYVRTAAIDPGRKSALVDLLNWIFTEGQRSMPVGYSPLPPLLLVKVKAKIP